MDGRDMAESAEAGLGPSPLMKWTSDGSMMEELLKSLTPGTQQPASHNETALVKDASISSSLLALIAQQEEENVAAEGQASRGFNAMENETRPLGSSMGGAATQIKAEESGWLLDRVAPSVEGQVAGEGGLYASTDLLSQGFPAASLRSPAVVSTGTAPHVADQDVQRMSSAGARSQGHSSIPILPSKLLSGPSPSFRGSPDYIARRAIPQIQVNLANVPSPDPRFAGAYRVHADPTSQYMAVDGYSESSTGRQATEMNAAQLRNCPQGLAFQQGMGSTSSLPPRLYAGSVQELSRGFESASLPSSASYQRPSSSHNPYQQPAAGSLHADSSREQLSTLGRQTDGHAQIHALLDHVGRAASAPRERPRPDISELPARPSTPTEHGSGVRTYYAHAGELGSQLAAEYMREAAQTSAHTYIAPPTQSGPPPTYTRTAVLERPTVQLEPQQYGVYPRSRPLAVPDPVAEPPAILTADFSRMGEDAPNYEGKVPQENNLPVTAASNALITERGASRAKRDRSTRVAKPPAGPKRSAVGPPPARAVSTDVEDDFEDHSAEAEGEIGAWEDTHMEDRDAKKQLRKEKNRASAAASRARREAYTASLEEEVAKLKEEKNWLEGQVNAPDHAMPMALPARAPIRHLSL